MSMLLVRSRVRKIDHPFGQGIEVDDPTPDRVNLPTSFDDDDELSPLPFEDIVPEPAPPLRPVPESQSEREAWHRAFSLGRDGESPALPINTTTRIRRAFKEGLEAGRQAREEDLGLTSDQSAILDRASGHPHLAEEYAEMRMYPR